MWRDDLIGSAIRIAVCATALALIVASQVRA